MSKRLQAIGAEVTKLTSHLEAVDSQATSFKSIQSTRIGELTTELQNAQQQCQEQQKEISRYKALLKSEHLGVENLHMAVDNMRTELQHKCVSISHR
jgi:uncharacterized protein YlxW (UPF0749 family)